MKNAEVKKIHHWAALVGRLGLSKNSHSYLKLILCCFLPKAIPHIQFHPNWMSNSKVKIFEIFEPQNYLEKSAKTKLLKLERFAWSH